MSECDNLIDQFEQTYVIKIREWSSYIPAEELEAFQQLIQAMAVRSEELGQQLYDQDQDAFRNRWQPLLKEILGLIPPLQDRLTGLKRDARANMVILGQGQRGLMGYRGILPTRYSRIDSNG